VRRRRRDTARAGGVAALAAVLAVTVGPVASAEGARLGPGLGNSSGSATCTASTCTLLNGNIPGVSLTSPIRGQVTSWKVRVPEPHDSFTNVGPVRLQVLKRTDDQPGFENDLYTVTRQTGEKALVPGEVNKFKAKKPIRKGNVIGLASVDTTEIMQGDDAGAVYQRWDDVLPPGGGPMAPDYTFTGSYYLFNARVQR
jgi:hypothetical protein